MSTRDNGMTANYVQKNKCSFFASMHHNNAGSGIEFDLRERMVWTRTIIEHYMPARKCWEFRSTANIDGFRYMCFQPAEKSVAFTWDVQNY